MKKGIKGFLFLFLILSTLLGCTEKSSNQDSENSNNQEESVTLKLAGMANESHPSIITMNEFAENIENKTDGRVKIKIYPSNQLGDWTTVYDEIINGTIEMGLISQPTEHNPTLEILDLP